MAPIFTQGARKVLKGLTTILPQHTKRLVLWSTLYSKMMCGDSKITNEQCHRLNSAMSLSKDDGALTLPSGLTKYIGHDLDACINAVKNAIRGDSTAAERAAQEFVRCIPARLRYASDAFMLSDFQSLMVAHSRARA